MDENVSHTTYFNFIINTRQENNTHMHKRALHDTLLVTPLYFSIFFGFYSVRSNYKNLHGFEITMVHHQLKLPLASLFSQKKQWLQYPSMVFCAFAAAAARAA